MPHVANTETLRDAIRSYQRDGAVVLRNVVSHHWIKRLAEASDRIMSESAGAELNRPGEGRFFAGMFSWLHEPEYAKFIHESSLAELAGRIMGASQVRFFYDQLLVKEPGTAKRTPWHQDLPYWPVSGEQILSIWIPIDAATPENGVVTYVKGSHRWNAFFPSESFSDNEHARRNAERDATGASPYRVGHNGVTLADITKHPERYEFLTWSVEPGDVIVHHPLAIHGAPGNLSASNRRRALATRWFGDDARWDDTRPHFMQRLHQSKTRIPSPNLKTGDRIDDPLFPLLWAS